MKKKLFVKKKAQVGGWASDHNGVPRNHAQGGATAMRMHRKKPENDVLHSLAQRFASAAERLDDAVARNMMPSSGEVRFTYVEYLEFRTADEFRYFRTVAPISQEEIDSVDIDALCEELASA